MPRTRSTDRVYRAAHASVRFVGPTLDPSEITRLLRLPPDHAHRAGDLRIGRSKSGAVIEYDPYRDGMWSMSSERWVESPKLAVHLEWLLQQLEPVADAIKGILVGNTSADLFCYSSGTAADPPSVPSAVRDRCEQLGLEISIDHYEE